MAVISSFVAATRKAAAPSVAIFPNPAILRAIKVTGRRKTFWILQGFPDRWCRASMPHCTRTCCGATKHLIPFMTAVL